MVAVASAAGAAIPLPGLSIALDLVLLKNEVNVYKSQLGIPEKYSSKEIQGMANAKTMATLLATFCAGSVVEDFARFIPFAGLMIASTLSFSSTRNFLNTCLDDMKRQALAFLDEMNKRAVDDLDTCFFRDMLNGKINDLRGSYTCSILNLLIANRRAFSLRAL
jgi:hypothetical protein